MFDDLGDFLEVLDVELEGEVERQEHGRVDRRGLELVALDQPGVNELDRFGLGDQEVGGE
jgi:hypothetical protein